MEWYRRVPGFFVSLLVTCAAVSAAVATDRPRGAAALLGTWGGPELGVWREAVVGLLLGLFTSLMCGLFTYLGGGMIVGLMVGGMAGSSIGSGLLRGSWEELAFGGAALAGIACGMGFLAARINAMIDAYDDDTTSGTPPSGTTLSGIVPPMVWPSSGDDQTSEPDQ